MRVDIGNKNFEKKVLENQQVLNQEQHTLNQEQHSLDQEQYNLDQEQYPMGKLGKVNGGDYLFGVHKDKLETAFQIILASFLAYMVYCNYTQNKLK
ncbi:hypothetical protein AN640_03390 [Candidatus Epulonipiscium fishelsonii]|uniref:Uncharacterized protein n=1 Tax=Candidatus Epulonipiscium fishelsonii TaxID=77094 RepID=A0ACC8XJ42_9FIRM|nr:hypothetical protein AN640_03390 [Epulopiscium sp. SCG-D08WGA-EpuloA1]OON90938.1 MAG: hypothetical protein ATN32_02890 [Epulopiscium sp. AS2M-Bin002]